MRGAIVLEVKGRDPWIIQGELRHETEKWLFALKELCWEVGNCTLVGLTRRTTGE